MGNTFSTTKAASASRRSSTSSVSSSTSSVRGSPSPTILASPFSNLNILNLFFTFDSYDEEGEERIVDDEDEDPNSEECEYQDEPPSPNENGHNPGYCYGYAPYEDGANFPPDEEDDFEDGDEEYDDTNAPEYEEYEGY